MAWLCAIARGSANAQINSLGGRAMAERGRIGGQGNVGERLQGDETQSGTNGTSHAELVKLEGENYDAFEGTAPAYCSVGGVVVKGATWADLLYNVIDREIRAGRSISSFTLFRLSLLPKRRIPFLRPKPAEGEELRTLSDDTKINVAHSVPKTVKSIALFCKYCGYKKEDVTICGRAKEAPPPKHAPAPEAQQKPPLTATKGSESEAPAPASDAALSVNVTTSSSTTPFTLPADGSSFNSVPSDWVEFNWENYAAFEGTSPAYCSIDGDVVKGENWAEVLYQITDREIKKNTPAIDGLYRIPLLPRTHNRYLRHAPANYGLWKRLANGAWINVNYSAPDLVKLIAAFCAYCRYTKGQLRIYGKPKVSAAAAQTQPAPPQPLGIPTDWIRFDGENASDFEGTTPVYCRVGADVIEARNWRDLLLEVTDHEIRAGNPAVDDLYDLPLLPGSRRPYLLRDFIGYRQCRRALNGGWLYVNYSIPDIVRLIGGFCKHCGYSKEEVAIYGAPKAARPSSDLDQPFELQLMLDTEPTPQHTSQQEIASNTEPAEHPTTITPQASDASVAVEVTENKSSAPAQARPTPEQTEPVPQPVPATSTPNTQQGTPPVPAKDNSYPTTSTTQAEQSEPPLLHIQLAPEQPAAGTNPVLDKATLHPATKPASARESAQLRGESNPTREAPTSTTPAPAPQSAQGQREVAPSTESQPSRVPENPVNGDEPNTSQKVVETDRTPTTDPSSPPAPVPNSWIRIDNGNYNALTRVIPTYCAIGDDVLKADSWSDLLLEITNRAIMAGNPAIDDLYRASLLFSGGHPYLMKETLPNLRCKQLLNGYWINVNYNTPWLIRSIILLCERCGYTNDQVLIYGKKEEGDASTSAPQLQLAAQSATQQGTALKTPAQASGTPSVSTQPTSTAAEKPTETSNNITATPPSVPDLKAYAQVLYRVFPGGYRLGDRIDLIKFIRNYNAAYPDKEKLKRDDANAIRSRILQSAIVYSGFAFSPDSMVSPATKGRLLDYIARAIERHGVIYYSALYDEFIESIRCDDDHVQDAAMLRAYLAHECSDLYALGNDYIASGRSVAHDPVAEIEELMVGRGAPMDRDEIYAALPHISREAIDAALRDDRFINSAKGEYFAASIVDLDEGDIAEIKSVIDRAIGTSGYITADELLGAIPEVIERFAHISRLGIRKAIAHTLAGSYSFNGNIISPRGRGISTREIFRNFAKAHERFTMDELSSLKNDLQTNYFFDEVYASAIRINEDEFISKGLITFDVAATDAAIADALDIYGGEYIPLSAIERFDSFPEFDYPWNTFLLEQYVAGCSAAFRLLHTEYAATRATGVIIRKTSKLTDYVEVVADALARSDVPLTKKDALNYLFNEGYITVRRYAAMTAALRKAGFIRNGGTSRVRL